MKTYGKKRTECANRKKPGTGMACSCCIPRHSATKGKSFKHRARQANRRAIQESI